MKFHIVGIALLAASAASFAQTQSGSGIGANTGGSASVNVPAPLPLPSTGTSADTAGTQGTSPRTSEPSGGSSSVVGGSPVAGSSSGRCDPLMGDERTKCLREPASTGTTGPGSTGMGSGSR
jgi:hypothetical protein